MRRRACACLGGSRRGCAGLDGSRRASGPAGSAASRRDPYRPAASRRGPPRAVETPREPPRPAASRRGQPRAVETRAGPPRAVQARGGPLRPVASRRGLCRPTVPSVGCHSLGWPPLGPPACSALVGRRRRRPFCRRPLPRFNRFRFGHKGSLLRICCRDASGSCAGNKIVLFPLHMACECLCDRGWNKRCIGSENRVP
jgi:hypothetical protein